MAQLANSYQQYSVCRKNLKLYEERLHQRSYSFSRIHKSMSRYHKKDIKMLVTLLPTLKMYLSVEINSEIIEAADRSCSLKKVLPKILKNSQENTSAGVSCLKIKTKGDKRNCSTVVFSVNFVNFFHNPSFEGFQSMAASGALSRITHQNLVNFQGKHLRRSSVIVKPLALRFTLILLINLKHMIS